VGGVWEWHSGEVQNGVALPALLLLSESDHYIEHMRGLPARFVNGAVQWYDGGHVVPSSQAPKVADFLASLSKGATTAAQPQRMHDARRWAVVGNFERNPIVPSLAEHLKSCGREVEEVDPYSRAKGDGGRRTKVSELHRTVDVVDLVVNPHLGKDIVEDAVQAGVKHFFIQPGAGNADLLALIASLGATAHEGCVLREVSFLAEPPAISMPSASMGKNRPSQTGVQPASSSTAASQHDSSDRRCSAARGCDFWS